MVKLLGKSLILLGLDYKLHWAGQKEHLVGGYVSPLLR